MVIELLSIRTPQIPIMNPYGWTMEVIDMSLHSYLNLT